MSLRAFHLLFIALSVVLAAFMAAWAIGQYQDQQNVAYLATGAASLVSAALLAVYAAVFQRKTRNM